MDEIGQGEGKGRGKGKGRILQRSYSFLGPREGPRVGGCSKYATYPEVIPLQSGLCCVVALSRTSSTKTVIRIEGIPSITDRTRLLVCMCECVCIWKGQCVTPDCCIRATSNLP